MCSVASLTKTNGKWKLIWKEYKQHPHFLQQFTTPITHQPNTGHIYAFDENCDYNNRIFFPMFQIEIGQTHLLGFEDISFLFCHRNGFTAEGRRKRYENLNYMRKDINSLSDHILFVFLHFRSARMIKSLFARISSDF